ncbi:MAG: iron-sulfur cluster assembly accessory protein [Euryarchaeota archaeon]|nr:iron-sulfur cluster assembly accessory protein [Euryarchaeota archaeon]|tara:strand:+ start:1342 stop:1776 length:435 start_codon:yes stop_codon:yes gene_type:complete
MDKIPTVEILLSLRMVMEEDMCGVRLSLPVAEVYDSVPVVIDFTDDAKIAIKDAMGGDNSQVLIVRAERGGCSGYLYDMQIDKNPNDEEFQTIEIEGIQVLVHNRDSELLTGITIDYKNTLMGGGFQISNPNANKSCGCGQSFS